MLDLLSVELVLDVFCMTHVGVLSDKVVTVGPGSQTNVSLWKIVV